MCIVYLIFRNSIHIFYFIFPIISFFPLKKHGFTFFKSKRLLTRFYMRVPDRTLVYHLQ